MKQYIPFILRLIPALIMLQTLYFKFSGATQRVYLFETLGLESHGRIGSCIAELIASILLLHKNILGGCWANPRCDFFLTLPNWI